MSSKELGLILAQQLLGVDDLHYGLWGEDLEPSFANMAEAQQRYTDLLISTLPSSEGGETRILDIGCGTGHILGQLLDQGYLAEGVVPSRKLADLARKRLTERPDKPARLFECTFEEFPVDQHIHHYDAALFSESFHCMPMSASLPILERIVKPGGLVVICDFFKTEHHGDGGPGDRSFGGGHAMRDFYVEMDKRASFTLLRDEDITKGVSPSIKLLDDTLMNKLLPSGRTLNRYLGDNYPLTYKLIKGIFKTAFRKKIEKQKYKYFSGHRSQAVFERYKTYHLIVLSRS